jgi:hypothetical protein
VTGITLSLFITEAEVLLNVTPVLTVSFHEVVLKDRVKHILHLYLNGRSQHSNASSLFQTVPIVQLYD